MSSNSNPVDLLNILATNQLGQLSKAGGYGKPGFLGNLLDFAAPAYAAAFPNAPVAQALNAGRQAFNVRQYNKYLQDQAVEAQRQQVVKQDQQGQLYGTVDPRLRNMQNISPEEIAKLLPFLGNADYGKGAAAISQGGYPESWGLSPADQVQGLVNPMLARQGALSDSGAYQQQAPGFFQGGRQMSQPGWGQPQQPQRTLASGEPGLVDINGNPTIPLSGPSGQAAGQPTMISGGVTQQNVNAPTVNPYFQGAVTPEQILNTLKAGVGDKQSQRQMTETSQHNRANEKIDQQKADADAVRARAAMIAAQRQGSGGSQNPYSIPNAELEYQNKQLNQSKQQLQGLGLWDSKNNAPKAIGNQPNQTAWDINPLDGTVLPRTVANPNYASESAGYKQKQDAINRYNALLGIAPFGGQSEQAIKEAGANASGFSSWKNRQGKR